jgi:FMN-dependent oxidoreductase (nitrilotriacetate monooxygenase family)
MMKREGQMRLGISIRYLGYHSASWRHPDVPADGAIKFDYFLNTAKKAEAAKLDMIFFADGLGIRANDEPAGSLCRDVRNVELEPLTLLAAIGSHTRHIGLVATASTTYNEPYHVARKYASIDHISGGRAGWNVVTSWAEQEAWNFSRDTHLGYETRYERAAEFVEVVKGLWDSWEDDAFIRDKASGVFYDASKMHPLMHKGKHFSVRGPLNSARTPQGRPIVVQAGASEAGLEMGASQADVVYTSAFSLPKAQAFYADLKARVVKHGRQPDEVLIMPGVMPFIGTTREDAQRKFDELQALIDPLTGLSLLYSYFGDLSAYDVDAPMPDIAPVSNQVASIAQNLLSLAHERGFTIRQLYEYMSSSFGVRIIIGTAEEIADELQLWFESGAADGFNFCPAMLPQGMDDIASLLLPVLRERGLFRTEYEASTLRGNLGLPELKYGE